MKAMVLTGHGGPECLELRHDVPTPVPRDGEVLVRVRAAAVNNTDINTRIDFERRFYYEASVRAQNLSKPTIAAVNGHALAGGFELVLNCDLVVSVDGVRFGIPEVKRGLYAAGGGTRLPRRVPLAVALEMGLTGDPITPQRAMELGLINQVVERAELMNAARALAARITCNGPIAVQWTKELMWDELGEPDPDKQRERGDEPDVVEEGEEEDHARCGDECRAEDGCHHVSEYLHR